MERTGLVFQDKLRIEQVLHIAEVAIYELAKVVAEEAEGLFLDFEEFLLIWYLLVHVNKEVRSDINASSN